MQRHKKCLPGQRVVGLAGGRRQVAGVGGKLTRGNWEQALARLRLLPSFAHAVQISLCVGVCVSVCVCAGACVCACQAACVALVDCLPEARQVHRRRNGARVTRQVRQGSQEQPGQMQCSKMQSEEGEGSQTPSLSAANSHL